LQRSWHRRAAESNCDYCEVEVICSNTAERKKCIENRRRDIPDLLLPDWQNVCAREYSVRDSPRLIIDTAGKFIKQSQSELLALLNRTSATS